MYKNIMKFNAWQLWNLFQWFAGFVVFFSLDFELPDNKIKVTWSFPTTKPILK